MTKKHAWKFFRAGGVDQVLLRDAEDLMHLDELDPKLWVALAMPTRGVYLDRKTLDAIDADHDRRVRLPEVVAAVRWTLAALENPQDLMQGSASLKCNAIRDPALRAGARLILNNLGKESAEVITIDDVADLSKVFVATRSNGDGVIPADVAPDAVTKAAIEDVIATQGSVMDRSGNPGVDAARIAAFFAEVDVVAKWHDDAIKSSVLGAETPAAAEATRVVRHKVDDFFLRCGLASLDPRAATAMAGSDADLAALAAKDLSTALDDVGRLPLAKIEIDGSIPIGVGVNPAWAEAMATFRDRAATALLGRKLEKLSSADWTTIKNKLSAYEAWLATRPVGEVAKLPRERITALRDPKLKTALEQLVAQDLGHQGDCADVELVQKLVYFHRDLYRLLCNFVNFSDFYGRAGAVFQAGTLHLDGRGCNLCLEVADPAKHATLASMSGAYLAYCDCVRPGGDKMTIVAAFTDGDSDNLLVGRNGVFFDRLGRDWDATITRIVPNPISIRQAFWSPYKKLVRLIEEQVGKRAAAADAEADEHLKATSVAVSHADKTPVDSKPKKARIDVGTVAAIGVAVGGIGAMVTGIITAFVGLGLWMPVGVLGLFLLISGPSMLLAFLKLRQRNLGPLLDANGWAINGLTRINVLFGSALTDVARLPEGARRALADPYAKKRPKYGLYLLLALFVLCALGWYSGRLDRFLPERVQTTHVLGRGAIMP